MEESIVHKNFMEKCISLGKIAKENGESPVGSLIVINGKIVGEGIEAGKSKKDITCHAEIEAIRDAEQNQNITDFSNSVLYTTHEPCIMCSYVIRQKKIPLIVAGLSTGEIGGYSSPLPVLSTNEIIRWGKPPKIIKNVLREECRKLSEK